jgi:RimJ/RimL family protein N-acetyltransferase
LLKSDLGGRVRHAKNQNRIFQFTAHAPELTDGVIVLRQRTLADVDAQLAGQDAETVKWLDWDAPTTENVTEMIVASARCWEETDGRCDFGVFDVSNGQLIGNSLANFVDPLLSESEVNVAYAVFATAHGHGFAATLETGPVQKQ